MFEVIQVQGHGGELELLRERRIMKKMVKYVRGRRVYGQMERKRKEWVGEVCDGGEVV